LHGVYVDQDFSAIVVLSKIVIDTSLRTAGDSILTILQGNNPLLRYQHTVRHPTATAGGLHQDSTALPHTS